MARKVKVSIKDKISFEVVVSHRTDVELKVSTPGKEVVVKLCCDSLSELLEELRAEVSKVLEELKDQSYIPVVTESKPL